MKLRYVVVKLYLLLGFEVKRYIKILFFCENCDFLFRVVIYCQNKVI